MTLIPAWVSNYTHYNVWMWNYLSWKWISDFKPSSTWHVITYPCWDFKLIHVSKGAQGVDKSSMHPSPIQGAFNLNATNINMYIYDAIFDEFGSGNVLLPNGTNTLPNPKLVMNQFQRSDEISLKSSTLIFNSIFNAFEYVVCKTPSPWNFNISTHQSMRVGNMLGFIMTRYQASW